MSHFSPGQLSQLGNALEAAGWSTSDVTKLGQAGNDRLTEIRLLLSQSDIVFAIEAGKTELRLHPDQETGRVQGRILLTWLKEEGLLDSCADLEELMVIKAKDIEFFRKHFSGKVIFGWRGVQNGFVPFLIEINGRLALHWDRINDPRNAILWNANLPALRRK